MRLGRVLGRYQEPAVVFGTSYIINVGQHSYGALSMVQGAADSLAEFRVAHPHVIGTEPEIVVLGSSVREYKWNYDNGVLDDDGIPKASQEVMNSIEPKEFPPALKDMICSSRALWRRTSAKSRWLQRADVELLAFVSEQAANGRECYVFTYDDDEAAPVRDMATSYTNVHLAEESLQNPSVLVSESSDACDSKPLLLSPRVVGELYGMPANREPTHYLLAARVPFAGGQEEIGVSIHPIKGKIESGDGGVRYPLLVYDMERLHGASGTRKHAYLESMADDTYIRAVRALLKMSDLRVSYMKVQKYRKHGIMGISRIDRHVHFSGGMVPEIEITHPEWLKLNNGYLRRFAPETLRHLQEFRRRFPK